MDLNIKKKIQTTMIHLGMATLAVCLGALYFLYIEIDADMTGSIMVPFLEHKYQGHTGLRTDSIWGMISELSYSIWGISEAGVKFIFAFFYSITSFFVFELCCDTNNRFSMLLLPLTFFMLIPGVASNKTHMLPTVLALLFLLYLQKGKHYSRFRKFLFWIFFLGMVYRTEDILLLVLWIFVPVFVYCVYKLLSIPKYSKYVIGGIVCGVMLLAVYYILFSMGRLSFMNKIYGVSGYYLSWAGLPKVWDKGIEFLLQAAVHAMNINPTGAIIQPMSAIWISKIAILILGLCNLVQYTKSCLKENNNWYRIIICGSIFLSAVMFLCNGWRISLYEDYGYFFSYSGYMGIVWPLLVVLAIDFLRCFAENKNDKYIYLLYVTMGVCFSAILLMEAVHFRRSGYKNVDQQVSEYLVDRGNEAGLAAHNAWPVTAWSKGKFFVMRRVGITEEGQWGYRQYDTVIECIPQEDTAGEEISNMDKAVASLYGEYDESAYFFEDSDRPAFSDIPEGRAVYSFDRDIRWPVRDYDLKDYSDDKPMKILFPLGESRVRLQGDCLENAEVSFLSEEGDELATQCVMEGEEECSYIVCCPNEMEVNVMIKNRYSENQSIYDSLKIEIVRAAICIKENAGISADETASISTNLKKGTYTFVINGTDLGNIDLLTPNTESAIILKQDGEERKIYEGTFTEDSPVLYVKMTGMC